MTLIASISGIRGTIGGPMGDNLTPPDIVNFTSAFGLWLTTRSDSRKVVVGRDARPSGPMLESLVCGTLVSLGFEVINLGLSTTPTVEVAIPEYKAAGGIVLTASHNPQAWNALKLLNRFGEFVTQKGGSEIMEILQLGHFRYEPVGELGKIVNVTDFGRRHIEMILDLPTVDAYAVGRSGLRVLVDGVNSSGGIFVPQLLRAMGITDIVELNCTPNGQFAHNPEPLKEHLVETCDAVRKNRCDIGIVVDPDVDRLVLIDENGNLFGEEYTLVAVADYILEHKRGAVVSNLSSSRALRDLAQERGCNYYAAAVGEVNVTERMKRSDAVIGGEGNGGVIYPELHYGRDALVGIALFLSHLVKSKLSVSKLRQKYPNYFMSKQKVDLNPQTDVDGLLKGVEAEFDGKATVTTIDGVKLDFPDSWVHLRKSNTEPIVRIYSEAKTQQAADELANEFKDRLSRMSKK
jgi:phosphomannomutase